MLHSVGFGNDVLYMIPKAEGTKEKIDKLESIKIKIFRTLKALLRE